MREIEYRGKRNDTGGWVYGFYVATDEKHYIFTGKTGLSQVTLAHRLMYKDFERYEVVSETVGQYTGLKAGNGVKIFEGDILQKYGGKNSVLVRWDDESCGFVYDCTLSKHTPHENVMSLSLFHFRSADYEIIENIHDNKNLLEEA